MKNKALEHKIADEILAHVHSRKTLLLSSLDEQGHPYASYAPFAVDQDVIYVLLSEIAVHGHNLAIHPNASVLIIEDEDTAAQLFARIRVSYKIKAQLLQESSAEWTHGIDVLASRQGERINRLSELNDFKLFRLSPVGGRYVKGFGKAYTLESGKLSGGDLKHLTVGHRKKQDAPINVD